MRDLLIVLQKELLELFGDWHSFYGSLIQTGILVVLCGIVVPADSAGLWADPTQIAALYSIFPSVLAATFAADSFAGERERKTLETLLATPLGDHAILLGKTLAAVFLALLGSGLAMSAGVLTFNLKFRQSALFFPSAETLAAVLGGALGFSLITASAANFISMRIPVARSAQQMASMLTVVLVSILIFILKRLHVTLDWASYLRVDGGLMAVGLLALAAGLRMFRRDRVFDPQGRSSRKAPATANRTDTRTSS